MTDPMSSWAPSPYSDCYCQGDALDLSAILPSESVDCVVTSTAYWGKRRYNDDYASARHPYEMGRGSLAQFIDEQVALGEEMMRLLKPTGTYWLNLGDTSSHSGGAGGDHLRGGSKVGISHYKQGATTVPGHQLCLVPQRIALALQDSGWIVRQVITWDKGKPVQEVDDYGETLRFAKGGIKPEDPRHVRRPRFASETILMLVKSTDYYYDHTKEAEPGDVWHFRPRTGKRVGPASFPEELPLRCISVSTRPGDLVLDPCCGSGTTCRVAASLGRHWIGVDLYPSNPEMRGEDSRLVNVLRGADDWAKP